MLDGIAVAVTVGVFHLSDIRQMGGNWAGAKNVLTGCRIRGKVFQKVKSVSLGSPRRVLKDAR